MATYNQAIAALLAALLTCCAEGGGDDEPATHVGGSGAGGSTGGGAPECEIDCESIVTPVCQVSRCNSATGKCEVVPADDGSACDDGAFCTVEDACEAGVCRGGPANDCGMTPGLCAAVSCDERVDGCITTPAPNGTACTPDDLCQLAASCMNGACLGTPNDCFLAPVPDDCHSAVCNPTSGVCEPVPVVDGESCIDPNDLCTVGKTCTAGVCNGGSPKDCSQLNVACLVGACDSANGQCGLQPAMVGQACQASGGACTTGVCDVNAVCLPQQLVDGSPCDDGDPCTSTDVCQSGWCSGATNPQCIKLLATDRGWWNNLGQHGVNGNTFTGKGSSGAILNSYFAFDLSAVSSTVIAAELVLELESYWGTDASETASIWDVSTSHATLVGGSFDPSVATDLQSGASYGIVTASPMDIGERLAIPLSTQALADINAHLGNTVAVGVHIDTAQTSGEQGLRFSSLTEPRVHWLVLTLQ